MLIERLPKDARYYQIAVLSALLGFGLLVLGFGFEPAPAALSLLSCVLAQYFFSKAFGLERIEYKSALISGISLGLLLRTNSLWLTVLAGVLTIGSKFLLRRNGKHFFNPTNFGIAVLLLCTDAAWVSPSQWGGATIFAAYVVCAGLLVVVRALRSDVTLFFLAWYVGLVVLRGLWLGDPGAIMWHQLKTGSLIIFAFFMISDPRTTPDSRMGRFLFAAVVAIAGFYLRFYRYEPDALILALFVVSCTTPFWDKLLPGERFEWFRLDRRLKEQTA